MESSWSSSIRLTLGPTLVHVGQQSADSPTPAFFTTISRVSPVCVGARGIGRIVENAAEGLARVRGGETVLTLAGKCAQ